MRDYVILTDSCSDMYKELREKYNIDYVRNTFAVDGTTYIADLDWKEVSAPDFYNLMRDGKRIFTSQVHMDEFLTKFEYYVSNNIDVLYIACSSALSASINASIKAKDTILEKYPNAKIICIDSLRSTLALANIMVVAGKLKASGKSIDEVANWVEENKLTLVMEATVDNLKYLKQAGRVSAASAFFGGLLNIKPIIVGDALGRNFAVEKVKGRKQSLERLVARMKEEYLDVPHQVVSIAHADCIEEALELKEMVQKEFNGIDINIGYVGPCVGASTGPGMIALSFFGKRVTLNEE